MDILVILFVVMIVASLMRKREENATADVILESECPPHQWVYQELKNAEGVTKKYRLVCKLCGPLKPLEVRESK